MLSADERKRKSDKKVWRTSRPILKAHEFGCIQTI